MKCDELKYESLGDMMPFYPRSTLVIRKQYVDAAIAELKAKLESVQASAYAESVDAGMENRKLKRALWLARADRAFAERRRYCAMAAFEKIENDALRIKWCEIQHKCIKKAEEYK